MKPLRVVLCTVGRASATGLARALVERRLAACVNVVNGLTSIYRWKGEICEDEEVLLVIKTAAERVLELTEAILDLHEYEVPEVISLPIETGEGNRTYLEWMLANLGDDST